MKELNLWVVYGHSADDQDEPPYGRIHNTYEKALEDYKETKRNMEEWVQDTGFTGDETVVIAKVEKLYAPVTKVDEEDVSFWFEWEEFEKEKCDYCNSIEISTPASPRRNYKYCPMCGRKREIQNGL